MTTRLTFLAATWLALLTAGCGTPDPEGARLAVLVAGDADGADARRLAETALAPTLLARDGAGTVTAGLASSWRFVDDGRTLILRLRPRQWPDGTPLTARQVVSAWRRAAQAREPALALAGIAGAAEIAAGRRPASGLGVLAPTSRVVEIRLGRASPLLLAWLAEPALAITRGGTSQSLADYRSRPDGDTIVLSRRDNAARPAALPAEIRIAEREPGVAIAAFRRGAADVVIGTGLDGLGAARGLGRGDALRLDPLFGSYGYALNSRRGPLADGRVRTALAWLVDRPAIGARLGLAALAPLERLVPVPGPAPPASVAWPAAGPARIAGARELLAAAGWSPARRLRLVLLLPPGSEHRRIAETVASAWRDAGIDLAIMPRNRAEIAGRVASGNFDLAVDETVTAVADPAVLLDRWRCARGRHCDAAADALLAAAAAAAPAERPLLLARAEAQLLTAPPLVPLVTPVGWALVARGVDGWVPNRTGRHPLGRLTATPRR